MLNGTCDLTGLPVFSCLNKFTLLLTQEKVGCYNICMFLEYVQNINFLSICLWCIPFAVILFSNEILDRITSWPREFHRKFAHILSGVSIVAATFYLNQYEAVILGVLLVIAAVGTRVLHFGSIHKITRKSLGTTLFPLALICMTLLWGGSNIDLVRYGILILTVPDALAAIIGSQWGEQLPRWNKSFLGSTVFFLATCAITLFFTQIWWVVLLVALTLTVIEFFSQWGIDNFLLPLSGGFLLLLLI